MAVIPEPNFLIYYLLAEGQGATAQIINRKVLESCHRQELLLGPEDPCVLRDVVLTLGTPLLDLSLGGSSIPKVTKKDQK